MRNAPLVPSKFILSGDTAIESVLTDIPPFCVGLMAFGVFTFFLVMKRVNTLAIYLYTSTLFIFIAAILDLSQVLSRDRQQRNSNVGINTVTGLIFAREIVLGLSIGFLYFFMWFFVSRCPRGECDHPLDRRSSERDHGARWECWGTIGIILKWSLLGASLAIPVLQIIWRVVPSQRRYGATYMADATLEAATSTLFIIKLPLNTIKSSSTRRWRSLRAYTAPVAGLLIGLGVGVGNLITFAFSETTLGRFLQALELYILILFLLITTFQHPTFSYPPAYGQATPGPFLKLPDNGGQSAQSPNADPTDLERALPNLAIATRPSRASIMSQLSAWVVTCKSPQRDGGQTQAQAETQIEPNSKLGIHDKGTQLPQQEMDGNEKSDVSQIDSATVERRPIPIDMPHAIEDQPRDDLSFVSASLASYYKMDIAADRLGPATVDDIPRKDSTVHGVDNILFGVSRTGEPPSPLNFPPNSPSSFDELLREQVELDKSIAKLLIESQSASTLTPFTETIAAREFTSNRTTPTFSSGHKIDSTSGPSEFSLSFFPDPPWAEADAVPPSPSGKFAMRIPKSPLLREDVMKGPRIVTDEQSTGSRRSDDNTRFDSAATHYDVTSFIGDLTVPANRTKQSDSLNSEISLDLIKTEGEHEFMPSSTSVIRPMILASKNIPPPPETSLSSAIPTPSTQVEGFRDHPAYESSPLRPFLLGTPTYTIPPPLPSSTMIPIGPRRPRANGLPPRPRLAISGPRPRLPSLYDDDSGNFEKPRAPPVK